LTATIAEECAKRSKLEVELNEAKHQITGLSSKSSFETNTLNKLTAELDSYRVRFADLEVNSY